MSASRALRNALVILLPILAMASAFYLLREEARRTAPKAPRLLFPSLGERIDEARQIRLVRGRGLGGVERITLEAKGAGFVILERGGFPAKRSRVRRLLYGLAQMEAHEARAAREERHADLGLVAPEKLGTSIRITVFDAAGAALADILLGRRPENAGAVLGRNAIYVRRVGEEASWLARGSLPLSARISDWMALPTLAFAPEDIRTLELIAPQGRGLSRRFTRPALARPFQPSDPRANAALALLGGLRFQDARPPQEEPPAIWRIRMTDFSAQEISLNISIVGQTVWTGIQISGSDAGGSGIMVGGLEGGDPERWLYAMPLQEASRLLGLFR